jgi:hypothetical protein
MLYIRLNNSGSDKEYNKPTHNEMLKIGSEMYTTFLPDGTFEGAGETAFKAYLQKIVLDITEKYGDKI